MNRRIQGFAAGLGLAWAGVVWGQTHTMDLDLLSVNNETGHVVLQATVSGPGFPGVTPFTSSYPTSTYVLAPYGGFSPTGAPVVHTGVPFSALHFNGTTTTSYPITDTTTSYPGNVHMMGVVRVDGDSSFEEAFNNPSSPVTVRTSLPHMQFNVPGIVQGPGRQYVATAEFDVPPAGQWVGTAAHRLLHYTSSTNFTATPVPTTFRTVGGTGTITSSYQVYLLDTVGFYFNTPIPALRSWGLAALALLLGGIGLFLMGRRRAHGI